MECGWGRKDGENGNFICIITSVSYLGIILSTSLFKVLFLNPSIPYLRGCPGENSVELLNPLAAFTWHSFQVCLRIFWLLNSLTNTSGCWNVVDVWTPYWTCINSEIHSESSLATVKFSGLDCANLLTFEPRYSNHKTWRSWHVPKREDIKEIWSLLCVGNKLLTKSVTIIGMYYSSDYGKGIHFSPNILTTLSNWEHLVSNLDLPVVLMRLLFW